MKVLLLIIQTRSASDVLNRLAVGTDVLNHSERNVQVHTPIRKVSTLRDRVMSINHHPQLATNFRGPDNPCDNMLIYIQLPGRVVTNSVSSFMVFDSNFCTDAIFLFLNLESTLQFSSL